ncbi:hypothetical protein B0T13DRAFT_125709 [Neurospora crassa]|nr:hypothetical protein B0T13DRAFT_125709 [Neurospora crassa]
MSAGLLSASSKQALQQTAALAARLAQSVERETLNLKVVGSTPTSGSIPGVQTRLSFCTFFCLCQCHHCCHSYRRLFFF